MRWLRVKKGMSDRYWLFFHSALRCVKLIVYVGVNYEHTLRNAASRTGVYEDIRRMLLGGQVSALINRLLVDSQEA
jgi:toxin YhaV